MFVCAEIRMLVISLIVSTGGNGCRDAAGTSKSHCRPSDSKVLCHHKTALIDFGKGCMKGPNVTRLHYLPLLMYFIILPFITALLVSILSKVCGYLRDSGPESTTINALHLHSHHFDLCGFKKLCRKLWLFCMPDVTALLQCALWGLTSYLILTL